MADAPPTAPKPSAQEWFLGFLGASDSAAELPLPEWRRRMNIFCEKWIFALVVAFFIRHFCLELNRIPSASMEPMLYGDPGFTKGDFVIVDRLTPRFRDLKRWNVSVFHYPPAEIESSRGERARPAEGFDGERRDSPIAHPQQCSNFVKRAVVMPGDVFYIAGGDLYLKQDDGSFRIATKPPELQEVLWQDIYVAGAQPGYRPWRAEGGARLRDDGPADGLAIEGLGQVHFTQPLNNLYLKAGAVAVRPSGSADWIKMDGLSMVQPQFPWSGGQQGNIWDLDRWQLKRLTSADQDDPSRKGRELNDFMKEMVGDLRITARIDRIDGEARFRIGGINRTSGEITQGYDLVLTTSGWRVDGVGLAQALRVEGSQALVGTTVSFAHLDGQVVLRAEDSELLRQDVPALDCNLYHPRISFSGAMVLSGLRVSRDLHYCSKGFMTPADPVVANPDNLVASLRDATHIDVEQRDSQYHGQVRLPRLVRAQILGKDPSDLSRTEAVAAYGTGPANAITAPSGSYLFLGDNSPLSLDGREWGWVPSENLRGRAWLVIWPWHRWRVVR